MKIVRLLVVTGGLLAVSAMPARSQSQPPAGTQGQENQSAPLYRVTLVARTTKAINYRRLSGPTRIGFRGTALLPLGRGEAKVESKRGAIKIEAQFQKLQPATQFGPEYLTYVLWAITPEGRATNLGELVLDGTKSKLDTSAQLQAFALVATAEPYFAVMQPSDVVVLENVVLPDTVGSVQEIDAKYDLLQRGRYTTVSADYEPTRMDPKIPLGLYEARNAVRIAQAAGADHYAASSFQSASQLLQQAETYQAHKAGKKQVEMAAREAVQTAEDARAITAKRRDEERQAQERQAAAEREARAKAETAEAERAKLEAQLAAERAAREKLEAENARAAALAQQQAARTEADRARLAAEQAARETAEARAARSAAEAQQQEAERLRQKAEAEKAELRSRLLNQLNMILQTRDSVRGLIVNMSDVLFDTGSSTLRSGAREKLAKVSGILLAYPGLNLQVEGHTDSVGGDEYNQRLSELRAASVRDYLIQQGVTRAAVTARGFGKTQPVATNDTPEGRQQNRRVEIVVTGDAIGSASARSGNSPQ
jgi:outer membrane protein OmpA-like peptidoglycan-associated protein